MSSRCWDTTLAFYLLMPKAQIFLVDKGGTVSASGDLGYVEALEGQRDKAIEKQREIKEKGFLKAMWPAIIGMIFVVALWFFLIWLFIRIAYHY